MTQREKKLLAKKQAELRRYRRATRLAKGEERVRYRAQIKVLTKEVKMLQKLREVHTTPTRPPAENYQHHHGEPGPAPEEPVPVPVPQPVPEPVPVPVPVPAPQPAPPPKLKMSLKPRPARPARPVVEGQTVERMEFTLAGRKPTKLVLTISKVEQPVATHAAKMERARKRKNAN